MRTESVEKKKVMGAGHKAEKKMDDAAARSIVAKFGEMRSDLAASSGRLADLAAEESEHGLVAKALGPMEAERRCWRLVRKKKELGKEARARRLFPPPGLVLLAPLSHENAFFLTFTSQVGDVLVERTVGEVLPAVQSNQAQIGEVKKGRVKREGGGSAANKQPSP